MEVIDAHCHLGHTLKKGANIDEQIINAQKNNLLAIIDSPVFLEEYSHSLSFHEKYPKMIYVSVGAAPANYHEMNINLTLDKIKIHAEKKQIVAIGEVGLDYYWIKEQKMRNKQHEIFKQFIYLANELQLPLVIHSREAESEAVDLLKKAEIKVVMHSFCGALDVAKECVNRGYYISIPTSVTTRKKNHIIAKEIPIEHLLTETDAPFLSPMPEIKRNEPANVIYGVRKIAELKEQPVESIAKTIIDNAQDIFKLKF